MQKQFLFFILFILVSFNLLAQSSYTPRVNIFIESSLENSHHLINLNIDDTYKTNTNFNFGVDLLLYQHKNPMKFGLGLLYQFPTSIIGQNGNYSFSPLYAFTRFNILKTDFFSSTIQVKLGYNLFFTKINYFDEKANPNGGLYYSIGSVLILKSNFQFRLFYSVNYGKVESDNYNYLIKNNQISFGLGWGF